MRSSDALTAGLVGLCILVAADGCVRSRATRYYTLAALAPAAPSGLTTGALGLGPLRLPQYLRQDAMAIRIEPHRLVYCDSDLWAEPPEDAVAAVLRENLARLTGVRPVLRYPWRLDAAPARHVAVDVTAFELVAPGDAVLTARWELRDASGTLLRTDGATYREPADLGVASLAEALSRALLRLSQDLAAAAAP